MNEHRSALIRAAGSDAGVPSEFVNLAISECPWLDGAEEVSEALGPDLIAEQAIKALLTQSQVEAFFEAYNARVRAFSNPHEALQSEAYAKICTALAGHGNADAYGDGDYWVNEDSFSSRAPLVVVFNGFRFNEAAVGKLQSILSSYAFVFSELRVSSEEGAEVLTLHPA